MKTRANSLSLCPGAQWVLQGPRVVLDGVLAGCLAPVHYWRIELDLAKPQLDICLGFTLGWELEAGSL